MGGKGYIFTNFSVLIRSKHRIKIDHNIMLSLINDYGFITIKKSYYFSLRIF